jgi:hypothetical protein
MSQYLSATVQFVTIHADVIVQLRYLLLELLDDLVRHLREALAEK